MCRDSHPSRMPRLVSLAVFCTIALVVAALGASAQAGEDIVQYTKQIDRMTDGAFTEHVDGALRQLDGEFLDQLRKNDRVREAYAELLLAAADPKNARDNDWSGIVILETAPPDLALEVIVEAMRPGGRLAGYSLGEEISTGLWERDESGCIGCMGHVWVRIGRGEMGGSTDLYEIYLRTHSIEDSAPLLEYMLRRHPLRTMDILLDAYADELGDAEAAFDANDAIQKDLWAYEHDVRSAVDRDGAMARVRRLTRSKPWWVRLYVLGVMNMPRYFEREIVQRLQDDPNDLVRRLAKELAEDGPRRR